VSLAGKAEELRDRVRHVASARKEKKVLGSLKKKVLGSLKKKAGVHATMGDAAEGLLHDSAGSLPPSDMLQDELYTMFDSLDDTFQEPCHSPLNLGNPSSMNVPLSTPLNTGFSLDDLSTLMTTDDLPIVSSNGVMSVTTRMPRQRKPRQGGGVMCVRGCSQIADDKGGKGGHKGAWRYGYHCPKCDYRWTQIRPEDIGPDGDAQVRESNMIIGDEIPRRFIKCFKCHLRKRPRFDELGCGCDKEELKRLREDKKQTNEALSYAGSIIAAAAAVSTISEIPRQIVRAYAVDSTAAVSTQCGRVDMRDAEGHASTSIHMPTFEDDEVTADPPAAPAAPLPVGCRCWYVDRDGARRVAVVKAVHYDDPPPYYTITIDGKERSTVRSKLTPLTPDEEAAVNGPPTSKPAAKKKVSFKVEGKQPVRIGSGRGRPPPSANTRAAKGAKQQGTVDNSANGAASSTASTSVESATASDFEVEDPPVLEQGEEEVVTLPESLLSEESVDVRVDAAYTEVVTAEESSKESSDAESVDARVEPDDAADTSESSADSVASAARNSKPMSYLRRLHGGKPVSFTLQSMQKRPQRPHRRAVTKPVTKYAPNAAPIYQSLCHGCSTPFKDSLGTTIRKMYCCDRKSCSTLLCSTCTGFDTDASADRFFDSRKTMLCPAHDKKSMPPAFCMHSGCNAMITDRTGYNCIVNVGCEDCDHWECYSHSFDTIQAAVNASEWRCAQHDCSGYRCNHPGCGKMISDADGFDIIPNVGCDICEGWECFSHAYASVGAAKRSKSHVCQRCEEVSECVSE
jgi:hypothetical protein